MDSPIQSCLTCKTNFESYAALKKHRQLHEGNRRLIEINTANGKEKELVRAGKDPRAEENIYDDIGEYVPTDTLAEAKGLNMKSDYFDTNSK